MRILVVGDIGQPVYHVGDEAMTIASARFYAEHGHSPVLTTRDVQHSTRYIGGDYEYIPTLEAPYEPAKREQLFDFIHHFLEHNIKKELPVWAIEHSIDWARIERFIDDVSSCDGVHISGGGNLNSRYGWLLFERAIIALIARHRAIPLVVTGQSFGPVLSPPDAHILEDLLHSASLSAARERGSFEWALNRNLPTLYTGDDALLFEPGSIELTYPAGIEIPALPERYICVTLNELNDTQARSLAALLDQCARDYECSIVFLPHMGNPDQARDGLRAEGTGDAAVHARVAHFMQTSAVQLPIVHTDMAVRVHSGALLNLSSRYHPMVFSMAAAVPAVLLAPDVFTVQRGGGALELYGMQGAVMPLEMLSTPLASFLISAVMGEHVRESLNSVRAAIAEHVSRVHEAALAVLEGREASAVPALEPAPVLALLSEEWESVRSAAIAMLSRWSHEAGFEWSLSDRMHSWDAVYRSQGLIS
ncbi:MAG: polysaccharide pyruvyl transferase family protein [Rothia sp. (in: high G+C Gram-positive bacteria)]|uniref:polysaccharide pyruvyl transferase family protein n=1 Tax=Rothia sp. (in: high G+C Gram-positive bacteria) TaxID=1885016 RepID=UPI0026DF173A|nr:polysaccharide pyruvyl transferase family protein [Rothia sp. (in: high G+C Gram-positive bacteria)]MDO5749757.1 polysaccharide pyruvyl transferase family protein [Rothia sp. (in: high G+C Gram-positive bacteria)]